MITVANDTQTPVKCIINGNEQELIFEKEKKKNTETRNEKTHRSKIKKGSVEK